MAQQNPGNCLTDQINQQLKTAHPEREFQERNFNQLVYQRLLNNQQQRDGDITIPVVVHIINMGGPENISDATVIIGIQHMNEAFSNSGAYQQANGVNTQIQFCLAQQDPYGLPTTGIGRYSSPLTNLNAETQDAELKALVQWDPLQYLNIYLVNEITTLSMGSGVAGYAYLPSSHGMPEDGIVNEARWFGSSIDNSKIHIHEAGHYLGLYHTFNGACLNNNCFLDGDKVCDTPPDASTAAVECNAIVNTCSTDSDDHTSQNPFRPVSMGGTGDQPDMFVNYMDYGYQPCQHSFTNGQSDRMNAALNGSRASLLTSQGCNNACGVFADYSGLPEGTISAGIQYALTGFVTNTVAYNVEWLVNGTVVATTANYVYEAVTAGSYTVTFRAYNTAAGCYSEKNRTARVICGTQLFAPIVNPANPNPGEEVVFTGNTTPGTVSSQWLINGIPSGIGTLLNHTFTAPGEYYVSFVTTNSICADTSRLYVPVGQCDGGEALTWWYGFGNTLTFYGDDPIQGVLPSTLFHQEGVANICDINGNLLLYTDGIQVFNGQGVQLENGGSLSGGSSSTQAALIVPNPSYNDLYYIFTTGDAGMGGMHYATADISQNEIISDVPLVTPVTERQAAVKHCNGDDTWVVTKKFFTNAFYAYLVTDAGVNETPVISYAGTIQTQSAIGCMKFSPEGNKLAMAVMEDQSGNGYVELMDFDNETGMVSFSLHIQSPAFTAPYGIEFSPDGSKLYIGNVVPYPHAVVYQYDLSSGNAAEILASGQLVGSSSAGVYGLGTLQLAKNGKIYIARSGSTFLDAIKNPDLTGEACGFVDKAISAGMNNFGLPNLVVNSVASQIPYITGPAQICANSTGDFSVACGYEGAISWNYTGPGTLQTIDGNHAEILVGTTSGEGLLIASRDAGCRGILRDTVLVRIGTPQISLGADTTLCASGDLHLSPGSGYGSYLWNDGSTMTYLDAQGAGIYWVRVTGEGGCAATDTIAVETFDQFFDISLGNDVTLCPNWQATVTINPPQGNFITYEWSTGAITPSLTVGLIGNYSLAVTNSAGCIARDTIAVTYREAAVQFQFAEPATICPGGVLVLSTGYPEFVTEWHDQSDLSTFTAWQPGLYWATISNGCTAVFYTDSVEVTAAAGPIVNLGADTLVCPFVPFNLSAGPAGENTFLWNDSSQLSTIGVNSPGIYSVTVTNALGCETRESIEIMECPTSLDDFSGQSVSIYPNPANNYFNIYASIPCKVKVSVFNSAGALVSTKEVKFNNGSADVNIAGFAAGIYTVHINSSEISVVKRLVVKK